MSDAQFTAQRGRLQAIAYRMLGSHAEAEDVVQEAWLRWSRVDERDVADAEAYLVRVVTRLALDVLRSARVRRESRPGGWLPEPILTGSDVADAAVKAEEVSTALLLVLETLAPRERAVYVLREAFGYTHAEIGVMIDRSEPAVRQIARRARIAVEARHRRFDVDPATRRHVVEQFREACERGEIGALMAVLAPDVKMISDGGGRAFAPRRPILGRERVAHAILVLARQRPVGTRSQVVELNGAPGLLLTAGEAVVLAMTVELGDGGIAQLHVVSDPAKLLGVTP